MARIVVEDGPDRFRRVREEADALLGGSAGEAGLQPLKATDPAPPSVRPETDAPDRLRWYGGFAFGDDHRPAGFWEAHPSALFLLPSLELEGGGGAGCRLRGRRRLLDGEDPGRVRARLAAELSELAGRLAALPPSGDVARVSLGRLEGKRAAWTEAVREALAEIGAGRLSKVVLARTLDVTSRAPLDPVELVRALQAENRGTHVFLFEPEPGRPLVGAAPETVATLRSGRFECTAVAGSTRRGETPEERKRLARALLASRKDREEQGMVVEDVVERLSPLADDVRTQDEPHVLSLARIQHLETRIRARTGADRHVLELVEALHPTPAVCGLPGPAALAFLREEEPFQRGWYAGPVGWFDGRGDGVFAPALRMAVGHGRSWRLFAGAGIVRGSEPEAEWEETRIKFEPVLRALDAVAGGVPLDAGESGAGERA